MIKAIVVAVPDEFLERRAAEINAEHPDAPPLTAANLLEQRLRDVATDELRLALFGWPVETTVATMFHPGA